MRDLLTQERWLEYTLAVGDALEQWAARAQLLKRCHDDGRMEARPRPG